ncbi:ribonuclease G [Lactiplantibacillus dongliensis]|uniref:Ribonuclease G n=1 Tax=Lactiplantibacillus dongliensis TaxID=2559919 RepID=A0ABW1R2R6_9LACO|nr:ribonuclease G [Lactiplantibacillus dongliensis]
MMYNSNETPAEIKGWNWGAFMYHYIWGIGNHTYLPLLCLIPFFNLIWIFVCGAKGNEWAWRSGDYHDVETFKKVQATWNLAGLVAFLFTFITTLIAVFFFWTAIESILALG